MKKEQIDGLTLAIVQALTSPGGGGMAWRTQSSGGWPRPTPCGRWGRSRRRFAAVAVMQLYEDGALGLEDTLEHWLPAVAAWNGITVLQLLRHATGLPDYRRGEGFLIRPAPGALASLWSG